MLFTNARLILPIVSAAPPPSASPAAAFQALSEYEPLTPVPSEEIIDLTR